MSKIIRGTKPHVLLQGSTIGARQNNYLPLPGHVKDKKECKEIKTKRKKQKTTSSTTTKRCHSYQQVPKESSVICARNPQWLLQITTWRCQLLKPGPSQSPSALLPHVSNSVKYARQGFWDKCCRRDSFLFAHNSLEFSCLTTFQSHYLSTAQLLLDHFPLL